MFKNYLSILPFSQSATYKLVSFFDVLRALSQFDLYSTQSQFTHANCNILSASIILVVTKSSAIELTVISSQTRILCLP